MGNENLLTGTHNGHLMVAALKRHADKPVMFLGNTTLTGRETDVLQLLAQGCCNKSIARKLGIGVGTVKTHVKGVMSKLDATARTHAVVVATQRGLIRPGAGGANPSAGCSA